MMNELDSFLTPKEVSKILKVNYRKVLDLIAEGELKAYRVGRMFRIPRHELQRYLRSVRVETPWED